jgi:hypothetical protein
LYTDVDTKAAAPIRATDRLVLVLVLVLVVVLVLVLVLLCSTDGVGKDDAARKLGGAKGWCILIDCS